MFDIVSSAALLAVLLLCLWLLRSARRASHKGLRIGGTLLAGVLTVVAAAVIGIVVRGYWLLNRSHDNPVPQLRIAATPELVARGARFQPYCGGCHAPEGSVLPVGNDFMGDDAPPVGTFLAPNLTPVHLSDWSDGELVRAIREGIHRDGRALLIMPSKELHALTDRDVQAIVAWLRSLPPAGDPTPRNRLNVLGAALINVAPLQQNQPPVTEPVLEPLPGPTAEYGQYLAGMTCAICHGPDLRGDAGQQAPALTHVPVVWSESQFIEFMRSGVRPGGAPVDAEAMPWELISQFMSDDDDLRAVYAHIASLDESQRSAGP